MFLNVQSLKWKFISISVSWKRVHLYPKLHIRTMFRAPLVLKFLSILAFWGFSIKLSQFNTVWAILPFETLFWSHAVYHSELLRSINADFLIAFLVSLSADYLHVPPTCPTISRLANCLWYGVQLIILWMDCHHLCNLTRHTNWKRLDYYNYCLALYLAWSVGV